MENWQLKNYFMAEMRDELDYRRTEFHIKPDAYLFETVDGFNIMRRESDSTVSIELSDITKTVNGLVVAKAMFTWSEGISIKARRKTFSCEHMTPSEILASAANNFRKALIQ